MAKMRARAILPDGKTKKLFNITAWDFNWQEVYHYKRPTLVPAGSVIHVDIIFDKSADNPNNPLQPPQRIKWGVDSTDEMGRVIFNAGPVREKDKEAFEGKGGQRLFAMLQQLRLFDKNGDGQITKEELPKMYHRAIERLDHNGDGALDPVEIDTLGQKNAPEKAEKKIGKENKALTEKKKYYFNLSF
jgi:hypothetical protein